MTSKEKKQLHRRTIRTHRRVVCKWCFKMGIPWQGLIHDLSKYSRSEFAIYKYVTGDRSPHQVCREAIGYSPSWIFHYHRNPHHTQYWLDDDEYGKPIPIKMPYKYVIEMFCDMVGAGQAYNKDKWECVMPLNYYNDKCKNRVIHPHTRDLLRLLLESLATYGEDKFILWYKKNKDYIKNIYEKCLTKHKMYSIIYM